MLEANPVPQDFHTDARAQLHYVEGDRAERQPNYRRSRVTGGNQRAVNAESWGQKWFPEIRRIIMLAIMLISRVSAL